MVQPRTTEPGVVIVGAGHAGGRAAERLRAFGYDKTISLVGQEPYLPYERPPLSKGVLTAETLGQPPSLLPPEEWEALHINIYANTICRSIDTQKQTAKLSSGITLNYENLILATGLTPRQLPLLANSVNGIFSVNKYEDSVQLRNQLRTAKRILIIGAGFIGLEVAASATALGAKATVLEMANRPLQRIFSAELSAWITNWHGSHGADIQCGRQILAHDSSRGQHLVTLDNGERLEAELIVIGIGGTPNIDLAANAGLDIDNGILVDSNCRSSGPNIFAIGDIAHLVGSKGRQPRRLESWKNAEDTAAIAARNICGECIAYEETPWFWTDQFGHNLQFTGDISGGTELYERGQIGETGYLAYHAQGDQLVGAFGIDCGGDIRRARGHIEKSRPLTAAAMNKAGLRLKNSQPLLMAGGLPQ